MAKCFDDLASLTSKAGPLDMKTQRLVKLGVALGVGTEGDVQNRDGGRFGAGLWPISPKSAMAKATD